MLAPPTPRIIALVAACGLALSACGGGPEVQKKRYLVDDVELEGVKRFSKGQLLEHLHNGETWWIPFTPDYWHDPALLAVDRQRIEGLYRAHGYHHAVVHPIEVRVDEDDLEVDLTIRVEEGLPAILRARRFHWVQDAAVREGKPQPGAREQTPLEPEARKRVEALASLTVGRPFEVPRMNDDMGVLRIALQAEGYPLARVDARADVHEDARRAEVDYHLDPGPFARVGKVHFEGLQEVPEYMCQVEAEFAIGEPYSPGVVHRLESAVRSMDVFRWVTVRTEREVVDGKVDLTVRVSEAHPHSIRLGGGLSFETNRWQEQLTAEYTHTNLFGHLTRLDLEIVGGWAQLPNPWDTDADGPVIEVHPYFTKKGLLERHIVWSEKPSFEVDIQEGYQYYAPSNRFGPARWFLGFIKADLSHNIRFVDFFNVDPALDSNESILGRDFRDPYLLSFIELQADAFFVDNLLNPDDGVILSWIHDLAGGVFAGDFDYHMIQPQARGYLRVAKWLQVAARLRTSLILGYGDEPGAPIDRKLYLGGADTVRGWGLRRLSPRLEECDEENPDDCKSIPIGGQTSLVGNLELRVPIGGGFGLIGFVDAGDNQAGEVEYVPDEWNYSAGPGLRFDSPLGLIRLDLGFRLNDPGVYAGEPGWAIHFGFGEAF